MDWLIRAEWTPVFFGKATQLAYVDTLNIVFIIVLVICGITDMLYQRVFNFITYPAILTGLVLNTLGSGRLGFQASLIGFLIGFIVFFIMFLFAGMGGGDVKLMATIGALMGYPFIIYAGAFSGLFGFVMAIVVLFSRGRLFPSLRNVFGVFFSYLIPGLEKRGLNPENNFPIPYGYAMTIGSLWAWILVGTGVLRM